MPPPARAIERKPLGRGQRADDNHGSPRKTSRNIVCGFDVTDYAPSSPRPPLEPANFHDGHPKSRNGTVTPAPHFPDSGEQ
jgi:hypothetical protein